MKIGVPATEASLDLELFRGYELAPGSYDEVFSSRGVLRPAWKTFLKATSGVSRGEYVRRWEQAQRLLRRNSLAYPDLGDPAARRRPWRMKSRRKTPGGYSVDCAYNSVAHE